MGGYEGAVSGGSEESSSGKCRVPIGKMDQDCGCKLPEHQTAGDIDGAEAGISRIQFQAHGAQPEKADRCGGGADVRGPLGGDQILRSAQPGYDDLPQGLPAA